MGICTPFSLIMNDPLDFNDKIWHKYQLQNKKIWELQNRIVFLNVVLLVVICLYVYNLL